MATDARGNDDGTYDIGNSETTGNIMRIWRACTYGQCGIEGTSGSFPKVMQ